MEAGRPASRRLPSTGNRTNGSAADEFCGPQPSGSLFRNRKFADSPLEGTGFELPVPREIRFGFRGLVVCPSLCRGGLIDIAGSPNTVIRRP
jgi:hypothetical protein